jgi:type IV secretion system protein VirB10
MIRDNTATDPRLDLSSDALDQAQETAYPVVASQFVRRDRAGLMLGSSIALLLGAATLFAMSGNRNRPVQIAAPPVATPTPPPAVLPAVTAPAPQAVATPAPPSAVPVTPPPMPVINTAPPPMPMADRARAPALIVDNGPAAAMTAPTLATVPVDPNRAGVGTLSAAEQFALRLGGESGKVSSTRMTDPSNTIAQGTLMSAVLETAIDSDLPGYVRAVISRDVKSFDGTKVLVPRGSHVIGQYKSDLTVGQTRAYVLWTRLLRADGVSIALGSPATDSSGRNGLSGKVNSHFGKRFGSAILLSVIGAAGQAVAGGNSTVIVSGPQEALSSSARRDIDIPPTVRVPLGAPIKIFIARDLDFSDSSP